MARIETWFDQDLKNPVPVRVLTGSAFSLDNLGNLIGVKVTDGGEIITLAGSVTGYCMLADGQTVTVAGTRSGNMASIVLPQTAYTVSGPIRISIKLTDGSAITTLLACVGTVVRTQTGNIVNPGSVVQDWSTQISAQLQACQDAADNMGAMVAVAFNPSSVYAAGNYVTYNGGLYRITAAHEAGTTWANTSKTQVTVGAELSDLKQAFNNTLNFKVKLTNSDDLNNIKDTGLYAAVASSMPANAPTLLGFNLIVIYGGSYTSSTRALTDQILIDVERNVYIRHFDGNWSMWVRFDSDIVYNSFNLLQNMPHPSNGMITWDASGKTCTVNGTANSDTYSVFYNNKVALPNGVKAGQKLHIKYSTTDNNVKLNILTYKEGQSGATSVKYFTSDAEMTLPSDTIGVIFRLYIANGSVINNATVSDCRILAAETNANLESALNQVQSNISTLTSNLTILTNNALRYDRRLDSTDDLNNIKDTGLYAAVASSMPANAPTLLGFNLIVIYGGSYTSSTKKLTDQILIDIERNVYLRHFDGNWSDWAQFQFSFDALPPDYYTRLDSVMEEVLDHDADMRLLIYTDPHTANPIRYRSMKMVYERGCFDLCVCLGDITKYTLNNSKDDAFKTMRDDVANGGKTRNNYYLIGNHDIAFAKTNYGPIGFDYTATYRQMHDFFSRHLNGSVVFDPENPYGGYYYADYSAAKTRVICLNSSDILNADGTMTTKYDHSVMFQQRQITWFSSIALDLSDKTDATDWKVIVMSHFTFNDNDNTDIVERILRAYNSKAVLNKTFHVSRQLTLVDDVYTDVINENIVDDLTVNVDYTNYPGKAICVIHGHTHTFEWRKVNGLPFLGFTADNPDIIRPYVLDVNGITAGNYSFTTPGGATMGFSVNSDYSNVKTIYYRYQSETQNQVALYDENGCIVGISTASVSKYAAFDTSTELTFTYGRVDAVDNETCSIVSFDYSNKTIRNTPYGWGINAVITYD